MNQLEYVPGIGGASVQMDGPSSFVGIAENLRSREWEYDLGYRDLVSATRPAREVDVTFDADYATADDLRRVADADVTARTPGVFVAQKEWRQRGYILASNPNDIHYGRLSTELKIALLDGAWWRLVDKNFMPENTAPTYRNATGKSVTTVEAANVPLHALTVDGEAVQDGTPTPSAPVPIEVVSGLSMPSDIAWIQGGVSNSTGGEGSDANRIHTAMFEILPGVNYTVGVTDSNYNYSVRLFSGNTFTAGNFVYGDSTWKSADETYNNQNAKYMCVVIRRTDNANITPSNGAEVGLYANTDCIGLQVNGTITPIDLQGNVLASLPDGTKDELTISSTGAVILTKRVGVFDASSITTYGKHGSIANWFYKDNAISDCDYAKGNDEASGLSNRFAAQPYSNVGNLIDGQFTFGVVAGVGTKRLVFKCASASTAEEFNTWIASNQTTLYYPLTTPQTINLGYIDMPLVSDGSVVSVSAAVTPTITAEWQTSTDEYLDYPHNYPYDYQKTSSTESITPSVLTPSDVHLVIYGPAVNPYVIVGDNRYQVNATVPSGGYLTVDGRDKSIVLTLADGTVQNVFSSGVRGGGAGGGSYIFEQIPAGESEVTYDGSFGFDLGWYEEEGEPPWNQS